MNGSAGKDGDTFILVLGHVGMHLGHRLPGWVVSPGGGTRLLGPPNVATGD